MTREGEKGEGKNKSNNEKEEQEKVQEPSHEEGAETICISPCCLFIEWMCMLYREEEKETESRIIDLFIYSPLR